MKISIHRKIKLLFFFSKNNENMKFKIKTKALFEKPENDNGNNESNNQEFIYV